MNRIALVLVVLAGCASSGPAIRERWLGARDAKPYGAAPGARSQLLATHADGSKDFLLVLSTGDEVFTALTEFAKKEAVVAARFTAIGAVTDVEAGWYDMQRHQYRGMHIDEQVEVLSLMGDVGVGEDGSPIVHAHLQTGRHDGSTFGGHLLHAVVNPTLEIMISTFPSPMVKHPDEETGLQFF